MSGMEVWKHLKSGLETNLRVGRSKIDKIATLVEDLGNILNRNQAPSQDSQFLSVL